MAFDTRYLGTYLSYLSYSARIESHWYSYHRTSDTGCVVVISTINHNNNVTVVELILCSHCYSKLATVALAPPPPPPQRRQQQQQSVTTLIYPVWLNRPLHPVWHSIGNRIGFHNKCIKWYRGFLPGHPNNQTKTMMKMMKTAKRMMTTKRIAAVFFYYVLEARSATLS